MFPRDCCLSQETEEAIVDGQSVLPHVWMMVDWADSLVPPGAWLTLCSIVFALLDCFLLVEDNLPILSPK